MESAWRQSKEIRKDGKSIDERRKSPSPKSRRSCNERGSQIWEGRIRQSEQNI